MNACGSRGLDNRTAGAPLELLSRARHQRGVVSGDWPHTASGPAEFRFRKGRGSVLGRVTSQLRQRSQFGVASEAQRVGLGAERDEVLVSLRIVERRKAMRRSLGLELQSDVRPGEGGFAAVAWVTGR